MSGRGSIETVIRTGDGRGRIEGVRAAAFGEGAAASADATAERSIAGSSKVVVRMSGGTLVADGSI